MFRVVAQLAYATRFTQGNALRAADAYVRRTGGEAPAIEQIADGCYVIKQGAGYLRAM